MYGQQSQNPWDIDIERLQRERQGDPWNTEFGRRIQQDMMIAQLRKAQEEAHWLPYTQLRQGNLLNAKAEHEQVLPKAMNTTFGNPQTGGRYRGGGLSLFSLLPHLAKS